MDDRHVLKMPAYRFWAMEACITRVQAAGDIRNMAVGQSTQSPETAKLVVERLTIEMGEPVVIERETHVKPEPGAKEKLKRLMRN
jgi:hypothetical protein